MQHDNWKGGPFGESRESGTSYEQGTDVEFTLVDYDPADYFDVQVYRDAVYGTPVFKSVAGRRQCPHEQGTDPRGNFGLRGGFFVARGGGSTTRSER